MLVQPGTVTGVHERLCAQSAWRLFWDQQLLKLLDAQFARDLRNLHANLPPQAIAITISGRQLCFEPPLEDIRAAHYSTGLEAFVGFPSKVRTHVQSTGMMLSCMRASCTPIRRLKRVTFWR